MKRYQKISAGFTLAELLAVVIIVGMLSILGVGYYNKSVEQARFREGEALGIAIAESYARWCHERMLENPTKDSCQYTSSNGTAIWTPPLSSLDIEIPRSTPCNEGDLRCIKTKHFKIEFPNDGVLHVVRGDDWTKTYQLWLNPSVRIGGNQSFKDDIRCVIKKARGPEFCQAVGYLNCSVPSGQDYYACTRPK
ncbi:MAG: prepilin-type N-terminal cleavage/methylation domain-containing protein [Elusimicrobiaceae bacterium]|nr:prepilin-type N-terminal cleavage/methylation domain-containing protein [Elusimicrobiaceae bacterium]